MPTEPKYYWDDYDIPVDDEDDYDYNVDEDDEFDYER